MTPLEIKKFILKLRTNDTSITVEEKTSFENEFPILYKTCTLPNFDISLLNYMLNLKETVDNGEMSTFDASVQVSTNLAKTYIYDKPDSTIKEPTEYEKQQAYNKLKHTTFMSS
jgi:hypothetical protein